MSRGYTQLQGNYVNFFCRAFFVSWLFCELWHFFVYNFLEEQNQPLWRHNYRSEQKVEAYCIHLWFFAPFCSQSLASQFVKKQILLKYHLQFVPYTYSTVPDVIVHELNKLWASSQNILCLCTPSVSGRIWFPGIMNHIPDNSICGVILFWCFDLLNNLIQESLNIKNFLSQTFQESRIPMKLEGIKFLLS